MDVWGIVIAVFSTAISVGGIVMVALRLAVNQINKRFDDMHKRFDDMQTLINSRIDDLRTVVQSQRATPPTAAAIYDQQEKRG